MAAGGKSRPPVMQMGAGLVLILMSMVILYMYRVIDSMHQDQQAMRLQLAELQGTGYSSSPQVRIAPQPRPDFLPSPRRPVRQPVEASVGQQSVLEELEPETTPDPRKLTGIFTTGRAAGVGCYELDDSGTQVHDVSSPIGCHNAFCPDCFVTPATLSQDVALTIQGCTGAKWVRGLGRTGIWVYTFINTHATRSLSVTDNSGSPTVYNIPSSSFVQAFCASSLGTTDKLYFPSTNLPTLTVDNSMTLSAGNFDASGSSGSFSTSTGAITLNGDTTISNTKTFATGTGTVSLNGATTVKDSTAFTVGSSGSGGVTTLYGDVNIGSSTAGHSVTATVHGHLTQNDDGDGTAKVFTTATGGVFINAHTQVAAGKNLMMSPTGTGAFQTGTGSVALNGDVTITTSKKFSTGTGAVSLNGPTTVADSTTFTVGSSGSGGKSTFYGDLDVGSSTAGHSVTTNMYGSFTQYDDGLTAKSFTTATGAVNLNGDTTVASGKNLHMTSTGAGTFQTGTGTVTLNGDTVVSGVRTFTSGSGQVSLLGAVQLADGIPLSLGSAGAGGNAQFFGNVYIGGNVGGTSTLLDVYGDVVFRNDASGSTKTFTTATGAVLLNGDVAVATDMNLFMANTGTGQFRTGTGPVALNGNTLVTSPATFTIGAFTSQISCTHAYTDGGTDFCKASR